MGGQGVSGSPTELDVPARRRAREVMFSESRPWTHDGCLSPPLGLVGASCLKALLRVSYAQERVCLLGRERISLSLPFSLSLSLSSSLFLSLSPSLPLGFAHVYIYIHPPT